MCFIFLCLLLFLLFVAYSYHMKIQHWLTTFTKRDFWGLFLGLVFGVGIGAALLSYMVPDSQQWTAQYYERERMIDVQKMTMGNDMHMMDAIESEDDFLRKMIVHHEAAVVMAKQVLKLKPSTQVQQLALSITEAQQKEIAQMKAWLKK